MKSFISIVVLSIFLFTQSIPVHAKSADLNLSSQAQEAIHTLAKDILTDGLNPNISDVKAQLDPQDYATVQHISLLPDSPFYIFKSTWRTIRLTFTFNQVSKTYQRLHDGNEKTLEALLLLEKAVSESNDTKHTRLVKLATQTINSVGSDFDTVSQTVDTLRKAKSPQAPLVQEEAFRFAGYYLKHQILLQQQQDKLSSQDFVNIEAVRLEHLPSLAHIVVSENKNPEVFGEQLSQLLAPQTGSNYQNLATIAVLRDLEYSAHKDEQAPLKASQALLREELETKLSAVPLDERLRRVERYTAFIHGNPVRQFQSYNHLSKSFTSPTMNELTLGMKDQTAQNLKAHLASLDTPEKQQQFITTLFSADPVDFRVLAYLEVQLEKPQVLAATASAQEITVQENDPTIELATQNLRQIEEILKKSACQTYGQNPDTLLQSRFYSQASGTPDILDIRIARFLDEAMQECTSKVPAATSVIEDIKTKVISEYTADAIALPATDLPTKAQATALVAQEKITPSAQNEQKVAKKIAEETSDIQEALSENKDLLEKEVIEANEEDPSPTESNQVAEVIELTATADKKTNIPATPTPSPQAIVSISPSPSPTTLISLPTPTVTASPTPSPTPSEAPIIQDVVEEEQQIIEEIAASDEPTEEEIVEKEQQIIEEIVTEAENGETSPLVEELPEEVQQEIIKQTNTPTPTASPTATPVVITPSPTPIISTVVEPVISPTPTVTITPTPSSTPTPTPSPSPTPTTIIEQVIETVSSPTPTPELPAAGL